MPLRSLQIIFSWSRINSFEMENLYKTNINYSFRNVLQKVNSICCWYQCIGSSCCLFSMDCMIYLQCPYAYSWIWIQVNVTSFLYIFTIRDHNCYLQPLFELFCLCDLWSMNCLSLQSSQRFIVEFAWFIPELFVYFFVHHCLSFFLLIIILSLVPSCTASDYSIGISKLFLFPFDKYSLFVLYTRSYCNFNRGGIATVVC